MTAKAMFAGLATILTGIFAVGLLFYAFYLGRDDGGAWYGFLALVCYEACNLWKRDFDKEVSR